MAKKASSRKSTAKKASKAPKAAKKSARKTAKKATGKAVAKAPTKRAKKAAPPKAAAGKPSKPKKSARARAASSLTRADLKVFRKTLLDKRHDLVGDMTGIQAGALRGSRQEGAGDLSNMPTHPADVGSDNYEQEFTLGLLESERVLLKEIDEALQRIEDGTYGTCQGTGEPIGKARLMARPWAKYCIDYARKIEKGLVRPTEEPPADADGDSDDED